MRSPLSYRLPAHKGFITTSPGGAVATGLFEPTSPQHLTEPVAVPTQKERSDTERETTSVIASVGSRGASGGPVAFHPHGAPQHHSSWLSSNAQPRLSPNSRVEIRAGNRRTETRETQRASPDSQCRTPGHRRPVAGSTPNTRLLSRSTYTRRHALPPPIPLAPRRAAGRGTRSAHLHIARSRFGMRIRPEHLRRNVAHRDVPSHPTVRPETGGPSACRTARRRPEARTRDRRPRQRPRSSSAWLLESRSSVEHRGSPLVLHRRARRRAVH